jgi:hypothetical protein
MVVGILALATGCETHSADSLYPNMEAKSPDGRATGYVKTRVAGGATEAAYTFVSLQDHGDFFAHTLFGGANYGAKVSVSWLDSRNLLVKCQDCFQLGRGEVGAADLLECSWHETSVHYDFVGLSPLMRKSCP